MDAANSPESIVRRYVSLILGRELEVNEDVNRTDEAKWDSLKHVELIFMLEDEFALQISPEEMGELQTINDIVAKIEEAK